MLNKVYKSHWGCLTLDFIRYHSTFYASGNFGVLLWWSQWKLHFLAWQITKLKIRYICWKVFVPKSPHLTDAYCLLWASPHSANIHLCIFWTVSIPQNEWVSSSQRGLVPAILHIKRRVLPKWEVLMGGFGKWGRGVVRERCVSSVNVLPRVVGLNSCGTIMGRRWALFLPFSAKTWPRINSRNSRRLP